MVTRMIFWLLVFATSASWAQTQPQQDEGNKTHLPPQYAAQTKEASFVCGPFLPNQIEGITELMTLCGGRMGFKINTNTFMEPQLLMGSGHAQRYILGSLSFRTDVSYEDIIASIYGGADIHYPTHPNYDSSGVATSESTSLYFGGHIGGAFWAQLNDAFYFRTDMQFNLNPGTSLFIGFSLVMRFDPGSGQGNENLNQR